ncbi:hypothetical protein WA026_023207 [Henosepilachna vigintioctopunctata]|uniref:Adenylate cyclase N-terminal domain-containing protein n=1 Tax=Henosepilachna vigintioctopunctata TaxID=420089 RepID=A0AAW1VGM9_9CUCU
MFVSVDGMELETLYHRYCIRLKHALFMSCLYLAAIICSGLLAMICVLHIQNMQDDINAIVILSILTFILLSVLMASQFPIILESEVWALVSSLTVIAIVSTSMLWLAGRHAALPLFALILAIHTMLPLSRAVSIVIAVVVTLGHLATSVAVKIKEDLNFMQIVPEIILLLTASWTGLYYRHMTEAAHRRTFVGTRTCIESRVKLECEKEQQEQLLLSVIPAYIAAEVGYSQNDIIEVRILMDISINVY